MNDLSNVHLSVKVQYPVESAFLRAPHIKTYAKCKDGKDDIKIEEAYNLNNGFLVIADVDALFDKYLISVDPSTKKIVKWQTYLMMSLSTYL